MKIADAMEIATASARGALEDLARKTKGEPRFGTMMSCYRGEIPVALLVLPPNRDTILQVAHTAIRGFGPDLLTLSHDTYIAVAPWKDAKDPRTGKRWAPQTGDGPGTMQTYVEEFGYDGTIADALVTHVVNRAGDYKIVPDPYAVDGRWVRWFEIEHLDEAAYFDEGVARALRQMMALPTLAQVMPGQMPDWARKVAASEPERTPWVYDMVTASVIQDELPGDTTVALYAEKGSPRDQMFRKRFPRSQVIDPRGRGRWN